MAIDKLPVNFVDDILNTAISDKRRYNLINNSDGTISLEDVTTYIQIGSEFGAEQVNQTNGAVNALIDVAKEAEKDFVLINQLPLNFVQNIATIQDKRITSDSLADVYFTADTIDFAQSAGIQVDTANGSVSLTALRTPADQIKATITIRVV